MTNSQLTDAIGKLEFENKEISEKVDGFKSGGIELLDEHEINIIFKQQVFYALGWKKMKKGCKEMLETISDCAEINPKELTKKLGLETDEDARVDLAKIEENWFS